MWADSIIEYDLADSLGFGDLSALTATIEEKVAKFIHEVERFLSRR